MLSLLLTGGCQKTTQIIPKYNGNYPTAQIRTLWMVCSFNFRQKNPYMNQVLVWKTCDCYTDTIREVLTPEQVDDGEKILEINPSYDVGLYAPYQMEMILAI